MKPIFVAATATVALLAAAAPAEAARYAFTTIDGPASPGLFGTAVTDLNNRGEATGYYVDLGPPAFPNGPPTPVYSAFVVNTDGSGFTTINRPGYAQTGASGVNDSGSVVGVSVVVAPIGGGFLRDASGTFSDIDPSSGGLTAIYSEAIGIDDAGDVTGYFVSSVPNGATSLQPYAHGFIDRGGDFTQFDVPADLGFGTELAGITSGGELAGAFLDNSPAHDLQSFTWTASGGFQVVSVPGATSVEAGGINDKGDLVGSALTDDPASPLGYVAAGFLSSGGTLTPISVPGAVSTEPLGVNDSGQISGLYIDRTGIHGFIGSPVPEPAAWTVMLLGLAALGATLRRRRAVDEAPQSTASGARA